MLCLLSSGEPDVERDIVADVVPLAAPALRLLGLAMFVVVEACALEPCQRLLRRISYYHNRVSTLWQAASNYMDWIRLRVEVVYAPLC